MADTSIELSGLSGNMTHNHTQELTYNTYALSNKSCFSHVHALKHFGTESDLGRLTITLQWIQKI